MVKEKTGLDIKETLLKNAKPSVLKFDEMFTAPIFGYDSQDDYYRKAACYHRIPKIAVPTFFMNAFDDPIVGDEAIDFEVVKHNPNTFLGTTRYGGHIAYYESFFSRSHWFIKPVLDFLSVYR